MSEKRRDILAERNIFSLIAGAIFLSVCGVFRHFRIDDAYITYRYARHWAEGLGPVMNVGERVEGVSNLPWTAVLALLARTGLEPHVVAPWLAIACGLACIGLTRALAARWCDEPGAGQLAMLILALGAPWAVWGVSGMETLPYTLLICLLFFHASPGVAPGRNALVTGLLLGLVASWRPEGVLFALPIGVGEWIAGARPQRLVRIVAGALVVLVPLEAFRLLYYGELLPNTVYAKANFGSAALFAGALYVGKILVTFPFHFLACIGAVRSRLAAAPRAYLLGWVALPLAVALIAGGERFPGHRFLVPAWPAVAVAVELAWRGWRRRTQTSRLRNVVLVASAVLLAALAVTLFLAPSWIQYRAAEMVRLGRIHQDASHHAPRLAAEIRFLGALGVLGALSCLAALVARRSTVLALVVMAAWTSLPTWLDPSLVACRVTDPAVRYGRPVGEWLRTHAEPQTRVATNAAGALPYYSRLPIIDMLGLTDAHIARQPADLSQWIGHEKGDGDYVLGRRPDLIIFGGPEGAVEPWPFPGDGQIARSSVFARDYELLRIRLDGFDFVSYRLRSSTQLFR